MADEPCLHARLLAALDIMVLESSGAGALRLAGEPACWLWRLRPDLQEADQVDLPAELPFLAHFVSDAETFWDEGGQGTLRSGVWAESGERGEEIHLEATAHILGERRILLVRSTGAEDDRRTLIQKAREKNLEFLREISQHKKVEQLKNEFISLVSHELRTPLTSIHGALGLLAGGAAGELPEPAGEMVGTARRNSDLLVRIVDDLLDLQKMESGRMPFEFRREDLAELLSSGVESAGDYARQHDVDLDLLPSPAGARVRADRDRILQVLANLLSNAIKASPAGVSVRVRSERREDRHRIEVEDEGPGIEEEFRPRVFGKFAVARAGKGKGGRSTGLGLSIAKAIVEEHGGTIGFETRTGEGTTFWFELPAEDDG